MDLIKRYKLEDKVTGSERRQGEGVQTQEKKWSQNKEEREMLLQKRREEMVLSARRKMEERERGGG